MFIASDVSRLITGNNNHSFKSPAVDEERTRPVGDVGEFSLEKVGFRVSFVALTLLAWEQEEHLAYKHINTPIPLTRKVIFWNKCSKKMRGTN